MLELHNQLLSKQDKLLTKLRTLFPVEFQILPEEQLRMVKSTTLTSHNLSKLIKAKCMIEKKNRPQKLEEISRTAEDLLEENRAVVLEGGNSGNSNKKDSGDMKRSGNVMPKEKFDQERKDFEKRTKQGKAMVVAGTILGGDLGRQLRAAGTEHVSGGSISSYDGNIAEEHAAWLDGASGREADFKTEANRQQRIAEEKAKKDKQETAELFVDEFYRREQQKEDNKKQQMEEEQRKQAGVGL